jgi:hypothetical protein
MNIFNRWNKWKDIGIEYITTEYKWVVLQTRTRRADNKREIKQITIIQYAGTLDTKIIETLNKLIEKDNSKIDLE